MRCVLILSGVLAATLLTGPVVHAEYLCPEPRCLYYYPAKPTGAAYVPSFRYPDVQGHPYQFMPPPQLAGTPMVHMAYVPPPFAMRYPRYGYGPEVAEAQRIRALAESPPVVQPKPATPK
jgi:hypothetical protein